LGATLSKDPEEDALSFLRKQRKKVNGKNNNDKEDL